MSHPIRFADAQLSVRDLLRTLLSGRLGSAEGVTVSTRLPGTKSDDAPALPFIAVRVDANARTYRLLGLATVRVAVWHRDEGLGVDLAALCEGLLLSASSPEVRSIGPVNSPLATTDPDTGDPLAFFTVVARLRPSLIL